MMTSSSESLAATPSTEPAVPATLAAVIPLAGYEEFYKATPDQRARLAALIEIFKDMEASSAGICAAAARIAMERPGYGYSKDNLIRLRTLYRKTRDWRVLLRRHRGKDEGQPEAFVEFFHMRCEQNRRDTSTRAVMHQIKDEWARGESIPGYGTWREYFASVNPTLDLPESWPYGFFPRGWGKSNLYKKQSSIAQRKLARRGWAAAKPHLPHVIRDTSGLRYMELIVIDDFETDILIKAKNPSTGRWEITTCTGLLAMDVATRTRLGLALKPRFKVAGDDDKKRRIAITRADVQFLLHSVFSTHGLPADWGVTILCENAAAAITDDVADMLQALFGVQVGRTGMLSEKVLANGFVPKGGKPWEKGWIESSFNLMGNHAGAFAGQKGASYQLAPDDLAARLLYAENLLKTDGLTGEQIDQLKIGFWDFEKAITAYSQIFDFMERRTQHRMQGFDELCDYAAPGFAGLLTEMQAQQLPREVISTCTPVPRRESPAERKARLTQDMKRRVIAEFALALLLLTPKRCKLEGHRITFTHLGEGFTFSEAGSPVLALDEGTELLGYFDPARPERLFCCRLDGRFIGPVRRRGAVDIRDCEAIAAERGEITKIILQHVVGPVRARHGEEDRALAEMKAHNEALLTTWGATAPDPSDGTKRRHCVSAQLASAQPGAQPQHAAAAGALAVAVAQAGREDEAAAQLQAAKKAFAQRANIRAAQMTSDDFADFLDQRDPTAPASLGAAGTANVAAEDETLSGYL